MADIRINDLPVVSSADFTDNDLFLVLDDNKARLLQRPTLQAWILDNVQGKQGVAGVAGSDGKDGKDGRNGTNGANGISAYQVAVGNGFVGSQTSWLESLVGKKGDKGVAGNNGWSPVLLPTPRGDDLVIKLSDWTGGEGSKPTMFGYLGQTGIVQSISNAVNFRGVQGLEGKRGETGREGLKGGDGLTTTAISYKPNNSISVTLSDGSTISSNAPNTLTGWASYKDSVYTTTNPLSVTQNSQVVIPNNGANISSNFPTDITSFYSETSQKMLLSDVKGLYSVRIRLRVKPLTEVGFINISFSKDTTEIPFSIDIPLRGDSQILDVNVNTIIYGDQSIVTNGISARLKTFTQPVQIYDVEFIIAKLV